jgi:hypothetical protein
VGPVGEVAQDGPGVVCIPDPLVEVVPVEFFGGEVAEMLVDPVRGVAADDLVVPVGLLANLFDPGGRDIPIVSDLVVVEDHGRRDGREEPTDRRVGPGIAVDPGVLPEVSDDLAWRNFRVAAFLYEL